MKKTNVRKMSILKYFFEEPERKRLAKGRKEKIREFFHKVGLYKTPEEKRRIALKKERQRKENERKKLEELKIKEQQRRQHEIEENKKQKEIRKKHAEGEKRKQEELKKQEKERKRQELERLEAEKKRKELEKLEKQKSDIGKKEAKDIFKGLLGFKETAPAKAKGSKNLEKCLKLIRDSKDCAGSNLEKARKLYIEARNMYLKLGYHEKKEVYGQLMGLYNMLIK